MAFDGQVVKLTGLKAGADLTTKQFFFVKFDGSGDIILATALGEQIVAVLQNKPNTGEAAELVSLGQTKVEFGATLAAGAVVATSAGGAAVAASDAVVNTSDGGAADDPVIGSNALGIVILGAASGEVGTMDFQRMGATPTTLA